MRPSQSTFQAQYLVVDYISFKFQELDDFTLKKITSYLFEIWFNIFLVRYGKLIKLIYS